MKLFTTHRIGSQPRSRTKSTIECTWRSHEMWRLERVGCFVEIAGERSSRNCPQLSGAVEFDIHRLEKLCNRSVARVADRDPSAQVPPRLGFQLHRRASFFQVHLLHRYSIITTWQPSDALPPTLQINHQTKTRCGRPPGNRSRSGVQVLPAGSAGGFAGDVPSPRRIVSVPPQTGQI